MRPPKISEPPNNSMEPLRFASRSTPVRAGAPLAPPATVRAARSGGRAGVRAQPVGANGLKGPGISDRPGHPSQLQICDTSLGLAGRLPHGGASRISRPLGASPRLLYNSAPIPSTNRRNPPEV